MFVTERPAQAKAWQRVCGVAGAGPLVRLRPENSARAGAGPGVHSPLPPCNSLGAWQSLADNALDSVWMSG